MGPAIKGTQNCHLMRASQPLTPLIMFWTHILIKAPATRKLPCEAFHILKEQISDLSKDLVGVTTNMINATKGMTEGKKMSITRRHQPSYKNISKDPVQCRDFDLCNHTAQF